MSSSFDQPARRPDSSFDMNEYHREGVTHIDKMREDAVARQSREKTLFHRELPEETRIHFHPFEEVCRGHRHEDYTFLMARDEWVA